MAKIHDQRPRHEQIAANLRAEILSSDIADVLPPVKKLMKDYDASNGTIQRAIAVLRDEGFVESRQGAASKVHTEQLTTVTAGAFLDPADDVYSYTLIAPVEEMKPPADVAAALLVAPGGLVVRRKLLMSLKADSTPVELTQLYFPANLARGTALAAQRRIKGGTPAVFAELGITRLPGLDTDMTRPPTTEELELLELPMTVPVLRTFRVISSTDGVPVEVQVLVKGGHRFSLKRQLPAH